MQTSRYSFHGFPLTITSNRAEVSDLLHARLRSFAANGSAQEDLVFEFLCIPEHAEHAVERPSHPTRPVYEPPLGEVVYSDTDDELYIDYGDRVRVLCRPERGWTRVSLRESELENLWLVSHPMFTLPLVEILKRRGLCSVHAAGLSVAGRALLLAGPTGSGKSTLTLALVRAGFDLLGDDMVFVETGSDRVRVLAFPDEIDATDDTIRLFPELHSLLDRPSRPGWAKRQIWADEIFGVQPVLEAAPGAVVVLSGPRDGGKSVLGPTSRTEALLELTPNVLLTDPRSSQAHLDALAELVRESDCYRLEAGLDLEALPELLRTALGFS